MSKPNRSGTLMYMPGHGFGKTLHNDKSQQKPTIKQNFIQDSIDNNTPKNGSQRIEIPESSKQLKIYQYPKNFASKPQSRQKRANTEIGTSLGSYYNEVFPEKKTTHNSNLNSIQLENQANQKISQTQVTNAVYQPEPEEIEEPQTKFSRIYTSNPKSKRDNIRETEDIYKNISDLKRNKKSLRQIPQSIMAFRTSAEKPQETDRDTPKYPDILIRDSKNNFKIEKQTIQPNEENLSFEINQFSIQHQQSSKKLYQQTDPDFQNCALESYQFNKSYRIRNAIPKGSRPSTRQSAQNQKLYYKLPIGFGKYSQLNTQESMQEDNNSRRALRSITGTSFLTSSFNNRVMTTESFERKVQIKQGENLFRNQFKDEENSFQTYIHQKINRPHSSVRAVPSKPNFTITNQGENKPQNRIYTEISDINKEFNTEADLSNSKINYQNQQQNIQPNQNKSMIPNENKHSLRGLYKDEVYRRSFQNQSQSQTGNPQLITSKQFLSTPSKQQIALSQGFNNKELNLIQYGNEIQNKSNILKNQKLGCEMNMMLINLAFFKDISLFKGKYNQSIPLELQQKLNNLELGVLQHVQTKYQEENEENKEELNNNIINKNQ